MACVCVVAPPAHARAPVLNRDVYVYIYMRVCVCVCVCTAWLHDNSLELGEKEIMAVSRVIARLHRARMCTI